MATTSSPPDLAPGVVVTVADVAPVLVVPAVAAPVATATALVAVGAAAAGAVAAPAGAEVAAGLAVAAPGALVGGASGARAQATTNAIINAPTTFAGRTLEIIRNSSGNTPPIA